MTLLLPGVQSNAMAAAMNDVWGVPGWVGAVGLVPGPAFVQTGFDTVWHGAGAKFIAVSLAFFALSSIVAFYYTAETNLRVLLGRALPVRVPILGGSLGSRSTRLLQTVLLVSAAFGAVSTATESWELADIGVAMMVWLNIVGILIVQQPAFKALRDFERQQKAGQDPTFDPVPLGVAGATFWEHYRHPREQQEPLASAR